VAFWVYDITNEGTTDYDDNIIFGLYADTGVGGSQLSCDGVYESDDDNVYLDRSTTTTGAPLDSGLHLGQLRTRRRPLGPLRTPPATWDTPISRLRGTRWTGSTMTVTGSPMRRATTDRER
jgi:hypothetical protein